MSGFLPQLKEYIESGDVKSAEAILPIVDIEEDSYEYVTFIIELRALVASYYKEKKQLELLAIIQLIATSEKLPFTENWPQYIDLISNAIGGIVVLDKKYDREELLKQVLNKLPEKNPYVGNHEGINYNLACFYAINGQKEEMIEYIRRARFYFEADKFLQDHSFDQYKKEAFFKKLLNSTGDAAWIWWTQAWSIMEWYDESN